MGQSLHEFVIERLEESKGEWQSVADGSGVSRRTLEKIARREIADPGVSHIEIEPVESTDRLSVTLENDSGEDLRHRLAADLIGRGFELYELRAVNLSLEDIFRQLTTEEARAAQAA